MKVFYVLGTIIPDHKHQWDNTSCLYLYLKLHLNGFSAVRKG
jgi:hypothetical protein